MYDCTSNYKICLPYKVYKDYTRTKMNKKWQNIARYANQCQSNFFVDYRYIAMCTLYMIYAIQQLS